MARPVEYSEEVLRLAEEYLATYEQKGEEVPTAVGLCRHINRARSTVYEWASHSDKPEFSDIVARVSELQELKLVNGGLRGELNPQITKTMMAKHGYSDRQELAHTSPDGSMSPKGIDPTKLSTQTLAELLAAADDTPAD